MLKKLASMLLALALLVSVSGRAESQEQALSEDEINIIKEAELILQRKGKADGVTCKDTETTWDRVKRKTSETKQWILENKWKCMIKIMCVGIIIVSVGMNIRDIIRE
ncbi:MAG: hypothetical protein LBS61_05850 [Endomicrobium sp.]|jgi:TolA-binding protein|nr:hypothetical protein [Endomicrobium sp.]